MTPTRHVLPAAAAAALALGLIYAFDPAATNLLPPCPFRALTGLLCPGCGTLRAIHALLHGDPGRAFAHNPLVLGAATGLAAAAGVDRVTRGRLLARLTGRRALPFWAAAALGFAVARNLVSAA